MIISRHSSRFPCLSRCLFFESSLQRQALRASSNWTDRSRKASETGHFGAASSFVCGAFSSSPGYSSSVVAGKLFSSGRHLSHARTSCSMSSSSEALSVNFPFKFPQQLLSIVYSPTTSCTGSLIITVTDHRLSSVFCRSASVTTWDTSTWDLLCWRLFVLRKGKCCGGVVLVVLACGMCVLA